MQRLYSATSASTGGGKQGSCFSLAFLLARILIGDGTGRRLQPMHEKNVWLIHEESNSCEEEEEEEEEKKEDEDVVEEQQQ